MTFDEVLGALKAGISALTSKGEHERVERLKDIKGALVVYGSNPAKRRSLTKGKAYQQEVNAVMQDCIHALRALTLPETADNLANVLSYWEDRKGAVMQVSPGDLTPVSEDPAGAKRMQEVDSAMAKNRKHLKAARNSLHRVTFIGIGPEGMRSVCDMLDEIDEMIEHLTEQA